MQAKFFLEISQNLLENTCARVSFFNKAVGHACNFIKKETLAQVFSREIFEISQNTFTEHLEATASGCLKHSQRYCFIVTLG